MRKLFVKAVLVSGLHLLVARAVALATGAMEAGLSPHPRISILGDDCFCDGGSPFVSCQGAPLASSGVRNCGDTDAGSAANPYRIADWHIDLSGLKSPARGIALENTTKYVVIENVLIDANPPVELNRPTGLGLANVRNLTVRNSTFRDMSWGIRDAGGVTDSVFTRNLFEGNISGLTVFVVANSLVAENEARTNARLGLQVDLSDGESLGANNEAENNAEAGFSIGCLLPNPAGNVVNNIASFNGDGIVAFGCVAKGNDVLFNTGNGIVAALANARTVSNRILDNGGMGVSGGGIVEDNDIERNRGGVAGRCAASFNERTRRVT